MLERLEAFNLTIQTWRIVHESSRVVLHGRQHSSREASVHFSQLCWQRVLPTTIEPIVTHTTSLKEFRI